MSYTFLSPITNRMEESETPWIVLTGEEGIERLHKFDSEEERDTFLAEFEGYRYPTQYGFVVLMEDTDAST